MEQIQGNEMTCLNRVTLIGTVGAVNITSHAENRSARFSVCTNLAYMDSNGCACIETTWSDVRAVEGRRISGLDGIRKGDKVKVEGRLRNERYQTASGEDRTMTVIHAISLDKLDTGNRNLLFEKR